MLPKHLLSGFVMITIRFHQRIPTKELQQKCFQLSKLQIIVPARKHTWAVSSRAQSNRNVFLRTRFQLINQALDYAKSLITNSKAQQNNATRSTLAVNSPPHAVPYSYRVLAFRIFSSTSQTYISFAPGYWMLSGTKKLQPVYISN